MLMRLLFGGFFLLLLTSCGPQTYNYSRVNDSLPQLVVQADATIKAKPDLLQMRLGVVTESVSAGVALADNNQRMQTLMEMLAVLGISKDNLSTGQFQIRPEWSVPPRPTPANWRREIVAYRVSNDLNVETTRVDLAGELLALAQKAGANQIGGLQFGLADPEMYRQEAISKATANALRKAQTLAEAAGAQLGPIVSLSLNSYGGYAGPQLMKMERAMDVSSSVPVAAGKVDVQAGVSIIYRLLDGAKAGQ